MGLVADPRIGGFRRPPSDRSPTREDIKGGDRLCAPGRLFPSLTVDEHLRMLANGTKGKRWTPDAVYEPASPSAAKTVEVTCPGESNRCWQWAGR